MSSVRKFLKGKAHPRLNWLTHQLRQAIGILQRSLLSVPVRVKIIGMVLVPVLILGFAINYWIRASLADWLTWLLDSERVGVAMQAGGRSVLLVTLLAAIGSLLISWIMLIVLTTPILELKDVADRVRHGALDQRAPVHSRDEIGQVADSFNRMLDELVSSQRQLERSNRHLGSLYHVVTSIGHGLELGGVLKAALSSTLDVTGLESGWIYLRDPDSERFHLASAVDPPQAVASDPVSCLGEYCGCQQALMEDVAWNVPLQRDCKRLSKDERGEGHAPVHLSVPLRARELNLGVFNLLWTKQTLPSEEELELLEALGAQVSEAVANARLHADLREKEMGMEALVHSLVTAQEDERLLISSELHDGAGQELTSVLLRLKALESKQDAADLQQGVSDLCLELSSAIEHLRGLSHQLRPPDLEQLGLGPTLRNLLVDMLGGASTTVSFESNLDGERLEPTLEITLYRIAQEALTNIIRHAAAGGVILRLHAGEHDLVLEIEDDGCGFDPDQLAASGKTHIGLASIQERSERLGGTFVVQTGPGEGTRLVVSIPRGEVLA